MVRTQASRNATASRHRCCMSGSGLTPENELSANDLVRLLAYEYHDTRNFGSFYGGLVVPRQSPFIFLRNGSAGWQDRIALKTGTMDDPHSVCGMAGFLRKRDGGWITFAIIVNGGSDPDETRAALQGPRSDSGRHRAVARSLLSLFERLELRFTAAVDTCWFGPARAIPGRSAGDIPVAGWPSPTRPHSRLGSSLHRTVLRAERATRVHLHLERSRDSDGWNGDG